MTTPSVAVTAPTTRAWLDPARWSVFGFILLFVGAAAAATQLGLVHHGKANHLGFWSLVLIGSAMILVTIAIGFAAKGRFDGVLIDRYNRVTLTHFQILLWTLLVVAAYAAAMLTNLMAGSSGLNALDVSIPPELWLAMGISAGSFTTSKVLALKIPDDKLAGNATAADARWIDIFRSDVDQGDRAIDLSKLQMFFFTAVLVTGYAATVANQLLDTTTRVGSLPALNNTFVTLLAISNGTYLARKSAHLIANE
ncbi:MAG TPA: hypothetical protein VHC67_04125 [Gaiellaceae bacterium]|jgi:hypothetical protein|nr:hypothetical protein [Gaiellaceae bacterium]